MNTSLFQKGIFKKIKENDKFVFFCRYQNTFRKMKNVHINWNVGAMVNPNLLGSKVYNLHNLMHLKILRVLIAGESR